jgi:hypothetical protein
MLEKNIQEMMRKRLLMLSRMSVYHTSHISSQYRPVVTYADIILQFVRTHQVLLHLLTGKGALFKATPEVGKSMQDILRAERDVVESLGNVLADSVPSKSAEFKSQTLALSKTVTAAIRAH